uniref:Putative secreted peptide n=1 Tax=Anopheles braziliensis TaxID=58242 RepID=A0A2M3ZRK5_9DIPT
MPKQLVGQWSQVLLVCCVSFLVAKKSQAYSVSQSEPEPGHRQQRRRNTNSRLRCEKGNTQNALPAAAAVAEEVVSLLIHSKVMLLFIVIRVPGSK